MPDVSGFSRIEAARSDPQSTQAPADGWVEVTLPDIWSKRWPGFDGVVWYRLTWNQADLARPTAIATEGVDMAGSFYVNGTLLSRDPHQVEPLTHSWNMSTYQLLPVPLLRQGTNVLLVRVSGLSSYLPGLRPIRVGPEEVVRTHYTQTKWQRQDLVLFDLGMTTALGGFFLVLWLMRPRETAYGWMSLTLLAWSWSSLNMVVTSSWPFESLDVWFRLFYFDLLLCSSSLAMFALRYCGYRFPRGEALLWIGVAGGALIDIVAPYAWIEVVHAALSIASELILFSGSILFLAFAWRHRVADHWTAFSAAILVVKFGLLLLLSFGVDLVSDGAYFLIDFVTNHLLMLAAAAMLTARFVANLRRVEQFNEELTAKIGKVREDLAAALQSQHVLELANARFNERLNFAHDIHDGLGGVLVSSIATLEHSPERIPAPGFLSILKELRDDLRIIVDTSGQQSADDMLAELLVPLRHRLTRLCENQNIACKWQVSGIDRCALPASQGLDLMRILREGVTNVLKHSKASHLEIGLHYRDEAVELLIADNGAGFDPQAPHPGAGMRSMQARARRLGGMLAVESVPGVTRLSIHFPVFSAARQAD